MKTAQKEATKKANGANKAKKSASVKEKVKKAFDAIAQSFVGEKKAGNVVVTVKNVYSLKGKTLNEKAFQIKVSPSQLKALEKFDWDAFNLRDEKNVLASLYNQVERTKARPRAFFNAIASVHDKIEKHDLYQTKKS